MQKLRVVAELCNLITEEMETNTQEDPWGSLASQANLISSLQPNETVPVGKAITPSLVLLSGGRFTACFLSRFIYEDNKQLSWLLVKV